MEIVPRSARGGYNSWKQDEYVHDRASGRVQTVALLRDWKQGFVLTVLAAAADGVVGASSAFGYERQAQEYHHRSARS